MMQYNMGKLGGQSIGIDNKSLFFYSPRGKYGQKKFLDFSGKTIDRTGKVEYNVKVAAVRVTDAAQYCDYRNTGA